MIVDPNNIIEPLLAEKGLIPGATVQTRQNITFSSTKHERSSGLRIVQYFAKKKEQLVYCGYSTTVRSELIPETTCPYGTTLEACLVFLPVGKLAERISRYTGDAQPVRLYCQPKMNHQGLRRKLHNITPYQYVEKLAYFGQYEEICSAAQRAAMRNVFINEAINCLFYVQKDDVTIR